MYKGVSLAVCGILTVIISPTAVLGPSLAPNRIRLELFSPAQQNDEGVWIGVQCVSDYYTEYFEWFLNEEQVQESTRGIIFQNTVDYSQILILSDMHNGSQLKCSPSSSNLFSPALTFTIHPLASVEFAYFLSLIGDNFTAHHCLNCSWDCSQSECQCYYTNTTNSFEIGAPNECIALLTTSSPSLEVSTSSPTVLVNGTSGLQSVMENSYIAIVAGAGACAGALLVVVVVVVLVLVVYFKKVRTSSKEIPLPENESEQQHDNLTGTFRYQGDESTSEAPRTSSQHMSVILDEELQSPQERFHSTNDMVQPGNNDVVEPDVVEPDVVEPDVVEPDVVEPEVVEPDVVEPDVVEPEVVEPVVVEPEVVEPVVVEPEVVEPVVVEPVVVEPDVVEPDVVEPDVVEPDVVEPEVVEPDVVEPDVVEPEVVEPKVVEPGNYEEFSMDPFGPSTDVTERSHSKTRVDRNGVPVDDEPASTQHCEAIQNVPTPFVGLNGSEES